MNDAEQGAAEDVPQDVAQDPPSGPGRRAPSSPRHHSHRRRLFAARAEMGAQLGSSVWHSARAVGKRFRGCRAKCLSMFIRHLGRASVKISCEEPGACSFF